MKFPDDVYLTRCWYCHHGRPGAENTEIPDDKLFCHRWAKDAACEIIAIAQCRKVPGECLDFKPNPMFGICQFCTYSNMFFVKGGYCTCPGGPVNKRRVFLGGGVGADYWNEHALFTCDCYLVSEDWKDLIKQEVLEGRSPANFDPDTWEPLDEREESAAAREWARLQAEERARAAVETEANEKRRSGREPSDSLEQISIF